VAEVNAKLARGDPVRPARPEVGYEGKKVRAWCGRGGGSSGLHSVVEADTEVTPPQHRQVQPPALHLSVLTCASSGGARA